MTIFCVTIITFSILLIVLILFGSKEIYKLLIEKEKSFFSAKKNEPLK